MLALSILFKIDIIFFVGIVLGYWNDAIEVMLLQELRESWYILLHSILVWPSVQRYYFNSYLCGLPVHILHVNFGEWTWAIQVRGQCITSWNSVSLLIFPQTMNFRSMFSLQIDITKRAYTKGYSFFIFFCI